MTPSKHPCPDCGSSNPHHPWGDILILRCQSCGFAIGADDLHTSVDNWKRRARTKTEEMGPDIHWRLVMSDRERMDLIGCNEETFSRLKQLPTTPPPPDPHVEGEKR